MRVVLMALVAAACGSKGTEAPPVCTHIAKVCGATYTSADVAKCAADWPTFQNDFGPELTATFVACTNDATTCTEARACSRAAVAALRDQTTPKGGAEPAPPEATGPLTDPAARQRQWEQDMMRERMDEARQQMETARRLAEDRFANDPFFHDTAPLPPECTRADELCPKDEPFARRHCRAIVGDLRGDAANMAELARCHAAATSCAAFKKCRDDMWFKIN